jgi:hypothetical protein
MIVYFTYLSITDYRPSEYWSKGLHDNVPFKSMEIKILMHESYLICIIGVIPSFKTRIQFKLKLFWLVQEYKV